jgi:hypothetical protein
MAGTRGFVPRAGTSAAEKAGKSLDCARLRNNQAARGSGTEGEWNRSERSGTNEEARARENTGHGLGETSWVTEMAGVVRLGVLRAQKLLRGREAHRTPGVVDEADVSSDQTSR